MLPKDKIVKHSEQQVLLKPRRKRDSVDFAAQPFFPEEEDRQTLKSVFWFFFPMGIFAAVLLSGLPIPRVLMYGVAGLWGLALIVKARSNTDLIIMAVILYLPFAGIFKIPVLPGLNGTNILLLLSVFVAITHASAMRNPLFPRRPGFTLMLLWAFISTLSGVTIGFEPGGMGYLLGTEINNYKAWIDQFVVYFALYSLIRDKAQARRVLVYLMVGALFVMLYGAQEMLDKMGRASIEASRVGGTLRQPNDYGGLLVYSIGPALAIFLMKMHQIKAWFMAPYLMLYLKVLISTFSRGAYAGFVLMGLAVGFFRGKAFLAFWIISALVLALAIPEIVPESVRARLGQTKGNTVTKKLDKSSETRLVLWSAAGAMVAESPLLGKGFKAFPMLKARYTKYQVREADPHNMYLYIAAQMGIPALLIFLGLFFFIFQAGWFVAVNADDILVRATGMAAGGMVAGLLLINLFGSRMVNVEFTCYFWVILVMLQVHYADLRASMRAKKKQLTTALAGQQRARPIAHSALSTHRPRGPLANAIKQPQRKLGQRPTLKREPMAQPGPRQPRPLVGPKGLPRAPGASPGSANNPRRR